MAERTALYLASTLFLVGVYTFQQVCGHQADDGRATESDYYTAAMYFNVDDSEMWDVDQEGFHQIVEQLNDTARREDDDALSPPMQMAPHGYRPGRATTSNSCQSVRGVPSNLRSRNVMKPSGLANFYQKYTEAYGIPVLSSNNVPDNALRRACYTLRFLFADHSRIRQSFYRMSGRVAVIGRNEGTTNIPEHSFLPGWWNDRARGLGATPTAPTSSGGEENILCYQQDRYRNEDIFLHESAHGVHLLGAAKAIPGWDRRLRDLYRRAKSQGKWRGTYSMSTPEEYFAEGVQSFFEVNAHKDHPDGVHGPISTRAKLRTYDPALYNLILEVYPCQNTYLKRCHTSRARENSQNLQMDCDLGGRRTTTRPAATTGGGGNRRTTPTTTTTRAPATTQGGVCTDNNRSCSYWAGIGECNRNPDYMLVNCRSSCGVCGGGGRGGNRRNCRDSNSNCSRWAEIGECNRNPRYMHNSCKQSCGLC